MKTVYKILILVGAIFALVGLLLTFIFLVNRDVFGIWAFFPLFFVILGLCFIIPGIIDYTKNRKIIKNGKRIPAKICGYMEDKNVVINGGYAVNTIVRYFDSYRRVKETVIETGFQHGSNAYPIGMTVDLYEYDEKISWDRNSVRQETLFDERELMDGIEDNSDGEVIAVECPKCGASYCAAKEYASKCPYCGEENGKKGEA